MKNNRKKLYLPPSYLSRLVIVPAVLAIMLINLAIVVGFFLEDPFFIRIVTSWSALLIGIIELLAIGIVIAYFVISTHHIAGPIHHLENALITIGKGDLTTEIKFRKKDYHHHLPIVFNENIKRLRNQIVKLQRIAELLANTPNEDEENRKHITQLNEGLRAIRTSPSQEGVKPVDKEI